MFHLVADVATPPKAWAFHPVFTDFIVPIIFVFITFLGKKVIRPKGGWVEEDACMGPDLCIAAMSTGLVKFYELVKYRAPSSDVQNALNGDIGIAGLLLLTTFGLYMFTLCEHRDLLENRNARWRGFRLFFVCNAVGFLTMASFIVLIPPL